MLDENSQHYFVQNLGARSADMTVSLTLLASFVTKKEKKEKYKEMAKEQKGHRYLYLLLSYVEGGNIIL